MVFTSGRTVTGMKESGLMALNQAKVPTFSIMAISTQVIMSLVSRTVSEHTSGKMAQAMLETLLKDLKTVQANGKRISDRIATNMMECFGMT